MRVEGSVLVRFKLCLFQTEHYPKRFQFDITPMFSMCHFLSHVSFWVCVVFFLDQVVVFNGILLLIISSQKNETKTGGVFGLVGAYLVRNACGCSEDGNTILKLEGAWEDLSGKLLYLLIYHTNQWKDPYIHMTDTWALVHLSTFWWFFMGKCE